LRIFGCLVFIHVPRENRTKLKPSGKKGTFIGNNETSKAYKIYIPGQRKIEINQDVTFDEDEAFRRSMESHMDEDREEQRLQRKKSWKNLHQRSPF
jgi:hypothetical protein